MSDTSDDCVFCTIVAGEIPARCSAAPTTRWRSRTSTRRRPSTPSCCRSTTTRTPPPRPPRTRRAWATRSRWPTRSPGRRRRRLPPRRQHRGRRRPDRLPHPLPRARRVVRHDRVVGLTETSMPGTARALGTLLASACWPCPRAAAGGRRRARRPAQRHPAGRRGEPASGRGRGNRGPRRPRRGAGEVASRCVRERRVRRSRCPGGYTPSAPYGTGTDDYRCFLLDPELSATPGSPAPRCCPATPRSSTTSSSSRCRPSRSPRPRPRTPPRRARAGPASAAPGSTGDVSRTSTTLRGSAPGRPVARSGGPARVRHPVGRGQPDRHAGALQPARGCQRPTPAADLRLVSGNTPLPGAVHIPQLRRRSSCRVGPGTPRAICATGPPRSPSSRSASARPRAHHLPASHAVRQHSPSPATPSRAREVQEGLTIHGAAGHMHLLGPRDLHRGQPRDTRAEGSSTSRCGTSTTRAASRVSPSTSSAATQRQGHLHPRQWLRDELPAFEGQPGPLRRVGRRHHRRDVPRDAAGHPALNRPH